MPLERAFAALPALLLTSGAVPVEAAQRPNTHAELECGYCHFDTPRFGVDTRETVTFWRAEGDEPWLCERCHTPEQNFHPLFVAPGPGRLAPHAPRDLPLGATDQVRGLVVCTTCHFVHAADADHALLRGFPGSEQPKLFDQWQDLCRECHGPELEKRSPHAGDERACAFCHSSRPQPGQPVTVTPVGRRLCSFCHGGIAEAHFRGVTPYSGDPTCTDCHDPHLGKDHPARLKPGYYESMRAEPTLNPHGRRSACFACHADAADKTLSGPDIPAVCRRCHDSGRIPGMSHPLGAGPAGFPIPEGWPLAGGRLTCVTCHLPGHPGEGGRNLLRHQGGGRTEVCFRCHRPDQWAGRNPHREVAERKEGCEVCHAAKPVYGTDTRSTVTFRADVNIVCLACHDPAPHPGGVLHTRIVAPESRTVPEHFPLGAGRRITCATCHNPHIAPKEGSNLRGLRDPQAFCTRCHRFD